jgi:hypothetical protein
MLYLTHKMMGLKRQYFAVNARALEISKRKPDSQHW